MLVLLCSVGSPLEARAAGKIAMMPSYAQNRAYGTIGVNQSVEIWGRAWGGTAPYTATLTYGDGTSNTWAGLAESQISFYVGAAHTYSSPGSKTAALQVTDASGSNYTASTVIRVISDPTMDERVNIAIEKAKLHFYKYPAGSSSTQVYWYQNGGEYGLGATAFVLLAFEENGHLPGNDYQQDIYAELVQKGINNLASQLYSYSMVGRGALDSNGNGRGLNTFDNTYADCLSAAAFVMAFTSTNAAKAAAIPAGIGTYARTSYYDVVVDMIDSLYGSQAPGGGWHYSVVPTSPNTDADGSTHQWPNIVMLLAQERWSLPILTNVISNSMNAFEGLQGSDGGCGYTSAGSWENEAKTGGMLAGFTLGNKLIGADAAANKALGFVSANWNNDPQPSSFGPVGGWAGDFYAMYGVKKGLQLQGVNTISTPNGSHDWYQDMAGWLLGDATLVNSAVAPGYRNASYAFGQNSDGTWGNGTGYAASYPPIPSAIGVLVLTKAVTKPLPVAVIASIPDQSSRFPAAFTLDGSSSYHMDPNSSIVEYLWIVGTTNLDWSSPSASGKTASINPGWSVPGTYPVTLRVKDNNSPANYATASTTVNIADTDIAPVAVPINPSQLPSVYCGKIGSTILLDGSASYDPDGDTITNYMWDLNGDGQYGTPADAALDTSGNNAQGSTASVLYTSSFSGQIGLQVTANGKTSANNAAVDIYAAPSDLGVSSMTASAVVPLVSATVTAVFTNDSNSGQAFNNVVVRFYNGNPFSWGTQLGTNYSINLPIGGTATIDAMLALNGATNVYAFVDANNAIPEWNESNNVAWVDVSSANHPPVVSNPIIDQNATYGSAFSLDFPTNTFTDIDGDSLSYSATGLPPGITFSTTNFFGTPGAAGTYQVQLVAHDGKTPPLMATNTFTITVAQVPLTVSIDSTNRIYGTANPAFTGSSSSTVNGDDLGITFSTTATISSPVGTYDIIPAFADPANKLGNYAVTTNQGTLTVTKALLTVTADNKTRSYGLGNPPLTLSYTGFAGTDDASLLSIVPVAATTASAASPAASYPIAVSGGASSNYTFMYVAGTLAVTKASLVMVGDSCSRAYGQVNPIFSASITGVMNGDNISARFSTTATPSSPPGNYRITLNVNDPDAKLGNYLTTLTSGILTVTNALLVGQVASDSRAYGQTNPVFTLTYTGFVNGQGSNILTGPLVLTCLDTNGIVVDTNSLVGQYPITVASGQSASYYTVAYQNGTLSVTQALLSITANDATRVYGETNPAFSAVLTGFVNGEDSNVLNGELVLTTAGLTNSPVGTYAIVPSGLSGSNYAITPHNGTLLVTPAGLVVSADNQARLYGQDNPAWTGGLTGVTAGDHLSASFGTTATPSSPAGIFDILPVWLDPDNRLGNYTISTNRGVLTVQPAPLTVSADNQIRAYGATNPPLTASYNGFVNHETAAILTGTPDLTTSASVLSPAGTYPITAGAGTLSAPNYSLSFTAGNLLVTQAVLTVTADNQSRLYGTTNPVLTASYSGFANGDSTNVLSGVPTLTTAADVTSPVGTYPITVEAGTLSATNYSFAFSNGNLSIGKAMILVSADPQTRQYGVANPVLTVSYKGFVDGDTAAVLAGAPNLTTAATTNSPIGTYDIVVALGSLQATNYAFGFSNSLLEVTAAALTVTAEGQTKIYGQTNPPLTGSLSGIRNGDNLSPSFSTAANDSSSVGRYDIVPAITDPSNQLGNYSIITNKGVLTITPAALTVSIDDQTRIYGAGNPAFSGTLTGVTNNDAISATFATAATPASPSGLYAIFPVFADPAGKLGNYNISTNLGTLTLTKAPLTVLASNLIRPYGQNNPPLTFGYSGFVNNDDASLLTVLPTATTTAMVSSWLGAYPITVSGGVSSNYNFNYVNASLTVTKAELVVNGEDASRSYGWTNPLFTATMTGVAPGDGISFSLITEADTNSLPGQYDINIFLDDPNNRLGAYDVTLLSGVLTVTNALLTGEVASQTRGYGQTNEPFSIAYSGFVNDESTNVLYGILAFSCLDSNGVPVRTNTTVGSYAIHGSGQHATNYSVVYRDGNLSVTQAVLTVAANDASRVYGQPNPAFSAAFSGFVNGDTAAAVSGQPDFTTAATSASPAGSYSIEPGPGTLHAVDYGFAFSNATLTVTKAGLLVGADNKSRTYGGPEPVFTASYTGFINGDSAATVLSGQPDLVCTDTLTSPVGTYTITASSGSLTSSKYDFTFANGLLTISKAPLAVMADNQTRTYGATNPPLTLTYVGFVNAETNTVLNSLPVATTTAQTNSTANSYPITLSGGTSSNYDVSLTDGVLTVTKAALLARADNQSRNYGTSNPPLTITYTGFVNGDSAALLQSAPTAITSANTNSPVGTYPIVLSGGTDANYSVSLTNGNLTVNRATLTVAANNQTRLYGETNPVLTATITGFANGEDTNVVAGAAELTTVATASSPVGTYDIVVNLNDLSATNYSFSATNGVLTVGKALLTITANSTNRLYGSANPPLTFSYSGFTNGEDETVLTGAPRLSTVADTNSPAGSYDIVITLGSLSSTNYALGLSNGTLVVTQAPLIVTADNQTRSYGAADPTFTGVLTGIVNGDNIGATFDCSATVSSPIGQYDILPACTDPDARLRNYLVTTNSGTLSITPVALTVSADNQSRVYGSVNPALSGTLEGLVNHDNVTLTFTCLATPESPVATYDILPLLSDPDGKLANYTVTTTTGTLTITKAPLTVTANDQSRPYGQVNPALTIGYSGFVNGDGVDSLTVIPRGVTAADPTSWVGPYLITPVGGVSSNYDFTCINGTLNVTKAQLRVVGMDATKPYGSTNPLLRASITGLQNGDNIRAVLNTSADQNSLPGNYAIEIQFDDPQARLGAYLVTVTAGTLTVTPATLLVTPDNQSRPYGATNPVLTASYSGFVNGDTTNVLAGAPILSTVADVASPVGIYLITAALGTLSATNYEFSFTNATLTVGKAVVMVAANAQSRGYGDTNPVLTATYSGFIDGDAAGVLSGAPVLSTLADTNSPVGNYDITISIGTLSCTNYAFAFSNNLLTVTAATLTLTADNKSRIYGQPNPTFTGSLTGLKCGENLPLSFTTSATASVPVGSYDIVPGIDDPAHALANYFVTTNQGTLTVTASSLVITVDSQMRAYGAQNPALVGALAGVTNGDSISSTFVTAATPLSPVGSYAIAPVLADPGGKLANYTLATNQGTLTITNAILTARANDQSRLYGAPNPLLTVSYSGFVNGENADVLQNAPVASTSANQASPAGSYPITLTGGSAINYAVVPVNGTLTVFKAPLTITAADASRVYGLDNPVFTGSIVGLLNNDAVSARFASSANSSSPAGTYNIVPSLDDPSGASSNYSVNLRNGLLTVTAALNLTGSPLFYFISNGQTLVDTNATVADGGSLRFGNAKLTVAIATNPTAQDALAVQSDGTGAGQIGVDETNITFGGIQFASFSGGLGTNALVFSFDGNAAAAALSALLRHLTFSTTATNPPSRDVQVTLAYNNITVTADRLILMDQPPVAVNCVLEVAQGQTLSIPFSLVLSNDFDPDGDSLTVVDSSRVSTNGGQITLTSTNFIYVPQAGQTNQDFFAYVISDGKGGQAVGTVSLVFKPCNRLEIDGSGIHNAGARLTMMGAPSQVYQIFVSSDLEHWTLLTMVTATSTGLIEILDMDSKTYPHRFYRAVSQ